MKTPGQGIRRNQRDRRRKIPEETGLPHSDPQLPYQGGRGRYHRQGRRHHRVRRGQSQKNRRVQPQGGGDENQAAQNFHRSPVLSQGQPPSECQGKVRCRGVRGQKRPRWNRTRQKRFRTRVRIIFSSITPQRLLARHLVPLWPRLTFPVKNRIFFLADFFPNLLIPQNSDFKGTKANRCKIPKQKNGDYHGNLDIAKFESGRFTSRLGQATSFWKNLHSCHH